MTTADAFQKIAPYLPVGSKPSSAKSVDRTYYVQLADRDGLRFSSHRLYRDSEKIAESAEERLLLDSLESDMTIHVAEMAHDRVFVHAGVVGWRGHAIVLPGKSYSGKTTLTAALVRAGALYYSDEYAVFDRQGRIHPYARALHVRDSGGYRQTKHPAEELGGVVGKRSLPLGLVLVTRYRDGARYRPRRISTGQGVLELFKNTVSARRDPEAALNSFQLAIGQAKILRGVRGDADEAATRLLAKMP